MKLIIFLALNIFLVGQVFSEELPSLSKSKSRMQVLESQITSLKKNISADHNKSKLLHRELASIEKQIGEGVVVLGNLQKRLVQVEKNITISTEEIRSLQKKLKKNQLHLVKHVKARYQMGEYQPLKWLLNQENPYAIARILTYYQYLIQSRQTLIGQMQDIQKNLAENTEKLQKDLAEGKQLQMQLIDHQDALEKDKRKRKTLVQALNQDIQSREQALVEAKRNKAVLVRLIKSLSLESSIASIRQQPSKPFLDMRRKLPYPVKVKAQALRRMNQGVTFFADEGSAVMSVYPGKVIFSEWLKGYGLLLIVDHGRGFMTLYAHNQALFKHKGQWVKQGEIIASVGHTGGLQQNGLYFEVRQHGKALPPLAWFS